MQHSVVTNKHQVYKELSLSKCLHAISLLWLTINLKRYKRSVLFQVARVKSLGSRLILHTYLKDQLL